MKNQIKYKNPTADYSPLFRFNQPCYLIGVLVIVCYIRAKCSPCVSLHTVRKEAADLSSS